MRYKDELRIAGVTALFCCAMLMITAVVPKDTTVAKARKTFKEAPETAADAEAQAQSEAEDAGFTVYTEHTVVSQPVVIQVGFFSTFHVPYL